MPKKATAVTGQRRWGEADLLWSASPRLVGASNCSRQIDRTTVFVTYVLPERQDAGCR